MAVLCLEKLIILGPDVFFWLGGVALQPVLEVGNVFTTGAGIMWRAGRPGIIVVIMNRNPPQLISWLPQTLDQSGIVWQEGRVWSTDAPYRESRELNCWPRLHQEQDIAAIDMEYSALCTVAHF